MYHSAVGSLFGKTAEGGGAGGGGGGAVDPSLLDEKLLASGEGGGVEGGAKRRSVPDLAERLLVASEKQISAKLSVTEVLMSLSSKGEYSTAVDNCPNKR